MPTSGGVAKCMESIEKPLPPASISTNTRLFKNLKVITLKFLSLYSKKRKSPHVNWLEPLSGFFNKTVCKA
ncbi:hypothetical protein EMIT0P291_10392 [Pseudomonas sp. IT-P291]